MTTKQLEEIVRLKYPNIYRNNRGSVRRQGGSVSYGIPEPKRNESDSDLKGGDFVGFHRVKITTDMVGKTLPIFCNVEIKGDGDKIKEGQVRYHNMIIKLGGVSEIYTGDGRVINWITTKKEVNCK